MHERAERGEAAHGAYKGGLDAAQTVQLKSVTDAVLRRAAAAAAAAAAPQPAAPATGSGASAEAAADSLFRHLDQNGDGRIRLGATGYSGRARQHARCHPCLLPFCALWSSPCLLLFEALVGGGRTHSPRTPLTNTSG